MKKFKILSRKMIVDEPFCHIERQKVELPDGKTTDWFLKKSNDAVIIVPVLKTGKILLQKNYKHGSGEVVTEFPAGLVDKGETPQVTAARELLEETGFSAETFKKVGEVFADPTGSSMRYHFFIAENCEKVADQNLETGEQIEVFTVKNLDVAREILLDSKTKTSSATISVLKFAESFFENI